MSESPRSPGSSTTTHEVILLNNIQVLRDIRADLHILASQTQAVLYQLERLLWSAISLFGFVVVVVLVWICNGPLTFIFGELLG